MLVVQRRPREGITLQHLDTGEIIHLHAVEWRPRVGAVRIGIQASDDWSILRDELIDEQADAQMELSKQKRAARREKIAMYDGIQVRSIDEIGKR